MTITLMVVVVNLCFSLFLFMMLVIINAVNVTYIMTILITTSLMTKYPVLIVISCIHHDDDDYDSDDDDSDTYLY